MAEMAWTVQVPNKMLDVEEILLVARKRSLIQITTLLRNMAQDTIPLQDMAPLLTMATVHQGTGGIVLRNMDHLQIMARLLTMPILPIVLRNTARAALQDTAALLVMTILPPVLQITNRLPGTVLQNTAPLLVTGLVYNLVRLVVL